MCKQVQLSKDEMFALSTTWPTDNGYGIKGIDTMVARIAAYTGAMAHVRQLFTVDNSFCESLQSSLEDTWLNIANLYAVGDYGSFSLAYTSELIFDRTVRKSLHTCVAVYQRLCATSMMLAESETRSAIAAALDAARSLYYDLNSVNPPAQPVIVPDYSVQKGKRMKTSHSDAYGETES